MLGGFKLKKKKDKRKITFDGLNRKLPISYQKEIFLAVLVQSLSDPGCHPRPGRAVLYKSS